MRHPCGFTLIEVMISLFILSLVLFGVTAVEMKALRAARGILYFNRAILLAENMVEFMLAHGGDPSGYLQQWQDDSQEDLPTAVARVTGGPQDYMVTIKWGGYEQPCQQTKAGLSGCVRLSVTA